MKELAVVSCDENEQRRLRIYAFGDGMWIPRVDVPLRPEALLVQDAPGGRLRIGLVDPSCIRIGRATRDRATAARDRARDFAG